MTNNTIKLVRRTLWVIVFTIILLNAFKITTGTLNMIFSFFGLLLLFILFFLRKTPG
jgi:hypothetical protein